MAGDNQSSAGQRTAFISGHLGLTIQEFDQYYDQPIKDAIARGDHFVVGDAPGADWFAQASLWSWLPEEEFYRVTVYHMLKEPRHAIKHFKMKGGFTSNNQKDAAMTTESDYDIAWVRPGKEESVTARNLARRVIFSRMKAGGL